MNGVNGPEYWLLVVDLIVDLVVDSGNAGRTLKYSVSHTAAGPGYPDPPEYPGTKMTCPGSVCMRRTNPAVGFSLFS
jgi:hypothetical protein